MNFKFTIAKKLILGFGIVTLAIFLNIIIGGEILETNTQEERRINPTTTVYHGDYITHQVLILNSTHT